MENGNRNTQYRIQKDRIVRVPKASNIRLVVKCGVNPKTYLYYGLARNFGQWRFVVI